MKFTIECKVQLRPVGEFKETIPITDGQIEIDKVLQIATFQTVGTNEWLTIGDDYLDLQSESAWFGASYNIESNQFSVTLLYGGRSKLNIVGSWLEGPYYLGIDIEGLGFLEFAFEKHVE